MFCYRKESHSSQASYHCVPRKEKGRKEGHPPLCHPINPMLPEGDNRRQKPVTSCVSQDSFIFPSPYVLITALPLDPMCLWQLKIISHHKQADKMNHLTLYFHCCYHCITTRNLLTMVIIPKTAYMAFREAVFYPANDTWKQQTNLNFEAEIKIEQKLKN